MRGYGELNRFYLNRKNITNTSLALRGPVIIIIDDCDSTRNISVSLPANICAIITFLRRQSYVETVESRYLFPNPYFFLWFLVNVSYRYRLVLVPRARPELDARTGTPCLLSRHRHRHFFWINYKCHL